MTPANMVTLARILLVPVFVVAILSPWPEWFGISDIFGNEAKALVAAGVFVLISCTDWIDGYLARSRQEVTDFGKFLDPLADKILVAAALIALIELQVIPSWPVLIILIREFIVSGIRMVAATKGEVIAASWYGKAKTVFQIIAIVMFIVKDALIRPDSGNLLDNPLYIASWIVMIIALVLTIASMLDYIAKARPLLFDSAGGQGELAEERSESHIGDAGNAGSYGEHADDPHVSEELRALAFAVVSIARDKDVRIGCAESLTGGLLASAITAIPGSSEVFQGGIVSYSYEAKHKLLGVSEMLLEDSGAVNEECAIQMAIGAAKALDCDIAVSLTGIAGPGGEEDGKPVGTVFMGECTEGIARAMRLSFQGDREAIRKQSARVALEAFLSQLQKLN